MAVEKPPSAFESPPIATALATFALDDVPNANALLPFARRWCFKKYAEKKQVEF